MSKQTKILKEILRLFESYQEMVFVMHHDTAFSIGVNIQKEFKKSLNKNDIIRQLLNNVVLSNDEIIQLLRIIYRRKNE